MELETFFKFALEINFCSVKKGNVVLGINLCEHFLFKS